MDQVERFAITDAAKAENLLKEIQSHPDLSAEVKSQTAWIDCLRGRLLMKDSAKCDEARLLITRGLDALKKKEKRTAEDTKRIQKAETWLKGL